MKTCVRPKISLGCGDKQGFTLIEVMIGVLVFAVGIMAVTAMAIHGFNGFERARFGTVEVNRNIRIMDTFKTALYNNAQIFDTNAGVPSTYPFGNDNPDFRCWDFNNVVIRDVKLIVAENQLLRSPTPSGFYRLIYTKPGKQQVN